DTGIVSTHQWWWISLIGLLGVAALAFTEIRVITRALLTSELVGAALVTILSVVILATVIFSHGPSGQTFTINFLSLPPGSDVRATISLFAISLGVAAGAARIMYAQARDATGKRTGLAGLTKHGAPGAALGVVLCVFAAALIGQQLAGSTVIDATFYPLQIGT